MYSKRIVANRCELSHTIHNAISLLAVKMNIARIIVSRQSTGIISTGVGRRRKKKRVYNITSSFYILQINNGTKAIDLKYNRFYVQRLFFVCPFAVITAFKSEVKRSRTYNGAANSDKGFLSVYGRAWYKFFSLYLFWRLKKKIRYCVCKHRRVSAENKFHGSL